MKKFSKNKSETEADFGRSSEVKTRKPRSLRVHIWSSFMIFTIVILVMLWLFQYCFLEGYYETMKARDLADVADQISEQIDDHQSYEIKESQNLRNKMRELAFHNSFCIVITDADCNVELSENTMGSFSFFDADVKNNFNRYLYRLKKSLIDSGKDAIAQKNTDRINGEDAINEMFYITSVEDAQNQTHYIFIEASVEPVDATARIIKEQLIYITVIIFELAFIITLFISKRISKPLVSLTKTAEKFAQGDYTVKYDHEEYDEIKQLSDVLNTASTEVSKVTELRRDLIANVSHDLRTPLTMVKAYAEMIRDLSGDNPEKRNQHIKVIIDEADRLSNLVNNILELSKLESSTKPLELSEFSIHDKMDEVMARYEVLNERDGYNIHFEAAQDIVCVADISTIEQVFYNLINNAVNYCGEDKEVIIRQINKPEFVRIEVSDHGKGITQEQLPQIFDRYYRAPKTTRDVVGTGLGLSIVKQILKQHNYPFGVSSVEGEGSTFWFEIKIAE